MSEAIYILTKEKFLQAAHESEIPSKLLENEAFISLISDEIRDIIEEGLPELLKDAEGDFSEEQLKN